MASVTDHQVAPSASAVSGTRMRMSEAWAPWVFMAPFMAAYGLFLVYPFFKGIWISLHEWNLLAVAFNPDAKQFIGFQNYVGVMWGEGLTWSPFARPGARVLCLAGAVAVILLNMTGRLSSRAAIAACAGILVLYLALGVVPGEEGRWFDRRFWPTVGNTIVFVGITAPAITVIALVLAAMLNRETRVMAVFRTLFFLSQVLSVTVVTLIWQIMFSPRQGLIANVTELVGGTPISWLTDQQFAMAAIIITTVWWSLGIALILFLAGLQDIPRDIYEAAEIDGARGPSAFFHITLPNLQRTITLVVVLQIILHFQVFGQSHLMTQGGPNYTTQVLVRYIYQTAFRDSDLGRASAMAVFLFVIMAGFSALQFIVGRERD